MGSSAACWTAHFQGFGFNNTCSCHDNIIGVAERLVCSLLYTIDEPKIERGDLRLYPCHSATTTNTVVSNIEQTCTYGRGIVSDYHRWVQSPQQSATLGQKVKGNSSMS